MQVEAYLHNLHMRDKYCRTPSMRDLVSCFDDFRDDAIRNARIISKRMNIYDTVIGNIQSSSMSLEQKGNDIVFVQAMRDTCADRALLKSLNTFIKMTKPKPIQKLGQSEELFDIKRAKDHPIDQLFNLENPSKSSQRISCCCPLHDEKTPSFVIYLNDNSFKCFGCGAYGDSITLYMRLHNTDFKSAVKALQ